MAPRPSVALVSVSYTRAGTEEMLLDLGGTLAAMGCAVTAAVPPGERLDGVAAEAEARGMQVARAGRYFGDDVSARENLRALFRVFRHVRPTIVHVHSPWIGMGREPIAAAATARVPLRIRTEQNPVTAPLPAHQRAATRAMDALTHAITFVSGGNRERHLANAGRPRRKCAYVPNSVPPDLAAQDHGAAARDALRRELNLPHDRTLAVMVGRLEPRKGPIAFIEAARTAASLDPCLDFVVAGDGELRGESEALARRHGIADRVHFLGHRPDVRRLLPAFDLYVQPSTYEGMSIAMLEALASGLPLVSTHVDGVDEVAPDGEGAIVVPVGDDAALGRGIARLARDRGLRARCAATTRARVRDRFTTPAMVEGYLRVYPHLLREKGFAL